jgi:hypothetical protein
MKVTTFYGTHKHARNGYAYQYDGYWWRFDGEVQWKVTALHNGITVSTGGGQLILQTGESPEDRVSKAVATFIDRLQPDS